MSFFGFIHILERGPLTEIDWFANRCEFSENITTWCDDKHRFSISRTNE